MRINVRLIPLTPNIPGQAQMCIRNWEGAHQGLSFSVQRNQDGNFLDAAQNTWSSSPYWFELGQLDDSAEDVSVSVGADLIDPILENINANYRITVRDSSGAQGIGILKADTSLLPSSALGSSQAHLATGKLASPTPVAEPEPVVEPEPEVIAEPVIEAVEPEPIPEPEPEVLPEPVAPQPVAPAPAKKGGKGILIAIIVLLLLAAIGAAVWWFLNQKPAAPASAETPAAGACSIESMGTQSETAFLQSCLAESKDSQTMLQVIQQAKANNHCGIAQRLYANRAQSGDNTIALAYAKEYDPKFYKANDCFKEADKSTASYWYETVILNEPTNAEAKQRLEELAQ